MTRTMKKRTTSWRHYAFASLAAASLANSAEARGASLLAPGGAYHYNRRPTTLDLMGDIFSMPMYFNSLIKQHETQKERLHHSTPRYYVDEGPNGSELVVEVPGVAASDLSVELEDEHMLHVSGTRRITQQGKTVESTFDQMFRMDDDADVENLSVTLSAGILRVTAPRKEKIVKKIPISVNDQPTEAIEANTVPQASDGDEPTAAEDTEVEGLAITEENIV